jgi:hypothetical protein
MRTLESPVTAGLPPVLSRQPLPPAAPEDVKEVWLSRDWLVQVYFTHWSTGAVERITVCRTTLNLDTGRWIDGILWDDLMEVKRQIGRGDRWAIEAFPADRDVVDVANMRHLFVIPGRPHWAWTPSGPVAP